MKDIITMFATTPATGAATDAAKGVSGNFDGQITEIQGGGDLTSSVTTIMNAIVGALALVAVVVIIMGGVKYMTSNGDAGKVKTAKDTILYGLIGLIVCALAAAIVNFVIKNIIGAQ